MREPVLVREPVLRALWVERLWWCASLCCGPCGLSACVGARASCLLQHVAGRLPRDAAELQEADREPDGEQVAQTAVDALQVGVRLLVAVGRQQRLHSSSSGNVHYG